MSYILETLGRGLLGRLCDAFEHLLPHRESDDAEKLAEQLRYARTSADLTLRTGAAFLRECRLATAQRVFQQALQIPACAAAARLGLACVHDELGRSDAAIEALLEARQFAPTDAAIPFAIGLCQERSGDADAARSSYNEAVQLCPRLRNPHERLAALSVRDGRWDDAILSYSHLTELEATDLDAMLTLAALHLQAGHGERAVELFQRALVIEPETCAEALDHTETLESDGQLASAIRSLEKLIEKYPGVSEFHVHLGDLYVKAGDDRGAVRSYRAALAIYPGFLEATVKLGTQHLRSGRVVEAAQVFNRAVELNDRLLLGFIGLGTAQHEARRPHEASATFDLAVGLAPNSTLLLAEAARLQLRADYQKSSRRNQLDDTHAENTESYDNESDALMNELLSRHRRAILATPTRADLHYRYALLLRHAGEFELSQAALRRAVTTQPSFAKAQIKFGVALREAGRTAEAPAAFRAALLAKPQDIETHYQLALLFSQRGRFDLTVERFERKAANERDIDAIHGNLTLALQSVGMVDRAEATWRGLCDLAHPASILTSARFSTAGVSIDDAE